MMGVGFCEILVILLLALLLLKPADLPQAAKTMGLFFAKLRRLYQLLHYQWTTLLDDIETKAQHDKQTSAQQSAEKSSLDKIPD